MSSSASPSVKSWVEREFVIDGVLAVGGGRPDGSIFSGFATGELVLAHNEAVWGAVAASLSRLQGGDTPVNELLWGFENFVLCTAQRTDGMWLGVFTVPKMTDEAALTLRAKLDAFKEQSFVA